MKRVHGLYLVAVFLTCGCCAQSEKHGATAETKSPHEPTQATNNPTPPRQVTANEWVGVYSSPSEIGAFSGTVLVIDKWMNDDLIYRMKFYSDVVIDGSIEQDELSGTCLIEGDRIYIPQASGYYRDGKPDLSASVDRYTRVAVNGNVTLMRDDAYRGFNTQGKLYDYGVLIKIAEKADVLLDLSDVEHKSIKVLYNDKTKPWKDPFVNGPNER